MWQQLHSKVEASHPKQASVLWIHLCNETLLPVAKVCELQVFFIGVSRILDDFGCGSRGASLHLLSMHYHSLLSSFAELRVLHHPGLKETIEPHVT